MNEINRTSDYCNWLKDLKQRVRQSDLVIEEIEAELSQE